MNNNIKNKLINLGIIYLDNIIEINLTVGDSRQWISNISIG